MKLAKLIKRFHVGKPDKFRLADFDPADTGGLDIEKAEAKDPIEPMERAEPTDPMDRTDCREPIESNESSDQSDHLDVPERTAEIYSSRSTSTR